MGKKERERESLAIDTCSLSATQFAEWVEEREKEGKGGRKRGRSRERERRKILLSAFLDI